MIIDYKNKNIILNNYIKQCNEEQFINFFESLLRIIREWKSNIQNQDSNFVLNVKIIEIDKEYNICTHIAPNNFDSFLDLINNI